MKIRSDFVTNSSSSSFILAFTNKDTIAEELLKTFNDNTMKYFSTVYQDIQETEPLTKEDVIEQIKKYHLYDIRYDMYMDYLMTTREEDQTPIHIKEWEKLPEVQTAIQDKVNELIKEVTQNMEDKSYFVEVTYSDHNNSALEHHIMPDSPNCVMTLSYH
jgi:hypothetical protein